MDPSNAAVAKHTHVPPQLLEEVVESPARFEPVVRAMAVIHMDELYRRMAHPDTPLPLRLDFQRLLNKMSRLEPEVKTGAAGVGGGVVINITRAKDRETVVIESQSVPVLDDAAHD